MLRKPENSCQMSSESKPKPCTLWKVLELHNSCQNRSCIVLAQFIKLTRPNGFYLLLLATDFFLVNDTNGKHQCDKMAQDHTFCYNQLLIEGLLP